MYLPSVFTETDLGTIQTFVDRHPLATLALVVDGQPHLDHLPWRRLSDLSRGGRLIAHVAKSNKTWRAAESGTPALLAFLGASAYISPSLYPSKAVTHEVVPTWNYASVHLRGTIRCAHDRDEKRAIVKALTEHMESSRPQPWAVDDAPKTYVDKMLDGIVALTFEIDSVQAKFKASQNRLPDDRKGVVHGLSDDPSTTEAAELVAAKMANPLDISN